MRKKLLQHIKGDKATWAITAVLSVLSFLAVYSASTNLVYVVGSSATTAGYLLKHAVLLAIGLAIMYFVHRTPYRYFRAISGLGIVVTIILLIFTLAKGNTIEGANASRWLQLPIVGISFQPSTLAIVILMIYTASFLANNYKKQVSFSQSFIRLWIYVLLIVALIVLANLSTAILLFGSVLLLAFIGRHPLKNIFYVVGISVILMLFAFLFVKAFPNITSHRFDTWISRIENFVEADQTEESYQVVRAKMAIAKGGLLGEGAGKSAMKNFLPQSTSDFIYAIIVEEYGSLGAILVLILYVLLLYRFVVISQKAITLFGQLLVLGLGIPIIIQAFINMGVAVGIIPVTGQNLPLVSSGGTSIWMTCFALGLILSVSAHRDENISANLTEDDTKQAQEELAKEIIEKLNNEEK